MTNRSRSRFMTTGGAALAFGIVSARARAAQFELKCASNQALDYPGTIRLGQMWAAIERESGGRIHAQFYPNSLLGGDASMFSQLRLGVVQFYSIGPGQLAEIVPSANIGYLGFAYRDPAEGMRAMDGALGGYIRRETQAKNMYALRTVWDNSMYQIGANLRPIKTPDDLRGFKVRVSLAKILLELFTALGASPTPVGTAEVYTALQTKLVDGAASALGVIDAFKWYEVMKYISLTNHEWGSSWLIANGDVWKSLPPDLQEIVERNNTKYAMMERKDIRANEASLVAKMKSHGIAVNTVDPTPFRARLKSYYQSWANEFGPTEWGLLQDSIGHKLT